MLNKQGKSDIKNILPLRKYCHFRLGVFWITRYRTSYRETDSWIH